MVACWLAPRLHLAGERKGFFFEKQKTFSPAGIARLILQHARCRNEQKFFGSFFQKRTAFFYSNAPSDPPINKPPRNRK